MSLNAVLFHLLKVSSLPKQQPDIAVFKGHSPYKTKKLHVKTLKAAVAPILW